MTMKKKRYKGRNLYYSKWNGKIWGYINASVVESFDVSVS